MTELSSFFSLSFDRVLAAVEQSGARTTGMCYALNSLENRVYEIELEDGTRRVVKFYRPGRWPEETIADEHRLLAALADNEVPVCAPLAFADGRTLHSTDDGMYFALFLRVGGRAPEDLTLPDFEQLGRLVARIHNTGALLTLSHRPALDPETYGQQGLAQILASRSLSPALEQRYVGAVERLLGVTRRLFEGVRPIVLHADFHRGNLLRQRDGFLALDFDDVATGPAVQDLWLMLPGRPRDCPEELEAMLRGYTQMRAFDRSTLVLVEALRALRYVRYAGWLASRFDDPAFKRAFPHFGSEGYWQGQVGDLYEQLALLEE